MVLWASASDVRLIFQRALIEQGGWQGQRGVECPPKTVQAGQWDYKGGLVFWIETAGLATTIVRLVLLDLCEVV